MDEEISIEEYMFDLTDDEVLDSLSAYFNEAISRGLIMISDNYLTERDLND